MLENSASLFFLKENKQISVNNNCETTTLKLLLMSLIEDACRSAESA